MNRKTLLLFAALLAAALPIAAQVTVRNIIPLAQSNETNQDSEPNLAVNLANPLQIAASAFTPDPGGSATSSPIFVSTDGGVTWAMNNILPSVDGTGDITLRFGGTSSILYAGILRKPGSLRLNILRSAAFSSATPMDVLVDRSSVDQPYVAAATVSGGAGTGLDRVFIGHNDFGASAGRTATVESSTDSATTPAPAGFNARRLEVRTTAGQDLPPIRPAIHPDGTIYAAFYGWRSGGGPLLADVVVTRDDVWTTGSSQFANLVDGGDTSAGFRVATGVQVPFENFSHSNFGQERFVASNLSIAVDPRSSDTVYVAWADYPTAGSTTYTLHVRRSLTRGASWSGDLITIPNATNPALAVNSHGRIGFAYQELTGSGASQRWQTHLRRSDDGTTWSDLTLSDTPANAPVPVFIPYLGDYVHLTAVGKDFYGIFSANNTPTPGNFPNGVTYQRNVDMTSGTLRNLTNTADVAVSIDPFFFHVTEVAPRDDFYVRDWNSSPTMGDTGVEPSTNPVFYATSDVWNRRSNTPGSFSSGGPDSEDAGNGPGLIGTNYAFARVRRNATAAAPVTVNAHFLVSRFGTGSNYIDANDDPLAFPNPDPTLTFAPNDLELITPAWQWQLDAISSNHLCLAVEISTPGDPFVAPTLRGNTPGWPLTDLRVLNDNNKAQRNMGLTTTPATGTSGVVTYYALVHNAATFRRDMKISWSVDPEAHRRLRRLTLEVVGGERTVPMPPRGSVVLDQMKPGEDRWLAVRFVPPAGAEGETVTVNFFEMEQNLPVNGFSIGARLASDDQVFRDTLGLARSVLHRLVRFGVPGAEEQAKALDQLPKRISGKEYADAASRFAAFYDSALRGLPGTKRADLGAANANAFRAILGRGRAVDAAVVQASLLNDVDTRLTMAELAEGNVADVLQTVRWQNALLSSDPRFANCGQLVKRGAEFVRAYQQRKAGNDDYMQFVRESLPCLQPALGGNVDGGNDDDARDARSLQKLHRELLLAADSQ